MKSSLSPLPGRGWQLPGDAGSDGSEVLTENPAEALRSIMYSKRRN